MTNAIIERDEKGRIIKNKLSSEAASEISKARWDKNARETVEGLLADEGLTLDTAPAYIKLWCEKASRNDAASVQALKQLQEALKKRRERKAIEEGAHAKLSPGELCPYCQMYFKVELSQLVIEAILLFTGGLPWETEGETVNA